MQMQTKLQTKLTLKTTLIYGGSACLASAIIFGIGFFYLNIGNNERAAAATSTQITYTSSSNGLWKENSTWTGENVPENGERVIIKSGHTISIQDEVTFNGVIEVYGTLEVNGGQLNMDEQSRIHFHLGSDLKYHNKKDELKIVKNKWQGDDLEDIVIPSILSASGIITEMDFLRISGRLIERLEG